MQGVATKQTNVRLSERGREILAELRPVYGSEAKVIDAALGLLIAKRSASLIPDLQSRQGQIEPTHELTYTRED